MKEMRVTFLWRCCWCSTVARAATARVCVGGERVSTRFLEYIVSRFLLALLDFYFSCLPSPFFSLFLYFFTGVAVLYVLVPSVARRRRRRHPKEANETCEFDRTAAASGRVLSLPPSPLLFNVQTVHCCCCRMNRDVIESLHNSSVYCTLQQQQGERQIPSFCLQQPPKDTHTHTPPDDDET